MKLKMMRLMEVLNWLAIRLLHGMTHLILQRALRCVVQKSTLGQPYEKWSSCRKILKRMIYAQGDREQSECRGWLEGRQVEKIRSKEYMTGRHQWFSSRKSKKDRLKGLKHRSWLRTHLTRGTWSSWTWRKWPRKSWTCPWSTWSGGTRTWRTTCQAEEV